MLLEKPTLRKYLADAAKQIEKDSKDLGTEEQEAFVKEIVEIWGPVIKDEHPDKEEENKKVSEVLEGWWKEIAKADPPNPNTKDRWYRLDMSFSYSSAARRSFHEITAIPADDK